MKTVPSNLNTHNKPDATLVKNILVCAILLARVQEGKVIKTLQSTPPIK